MIKADFKILEATTKSKLEKQVIDYLTQGYKLHGELEVYYVTDNKRAGGMCYRIIVVRYLKTI